MILRTAESGFLLDPTARPTTSRRSSIIRVLLLRRRLLRIINNRIRRHKTIQSDSRRLTGIRLLLLPVSRIHIPISCGDSAAAAAASPESYFSSCASFPIFLFQQKWENVVVMEGAIGRRNCVVVKNSRDAVRPRISVAPAEKGGIKKKPLRNQ